MDIFSRAFGAAPRKLSAAFIAAIHETLTEIVLALCWRSKSRENYKFPVPSLLGNRPTVYLLRRM